MSGETLQKKIDNAVAYATGNLKGIRAGRATPELVEDVSVAYYGSEVPLKQIASVSIPEARTIAISPWDKEAVDAIAKALEQADLGAMPSVKGETIHVVLPPLTSERRGELVKVVGKVVEEGRISIRNIRDEAIEDIRKKEEAGDISEDDFFRQKENIEEKVKKANEQLEEMREEKEEELETV